MRDRHVEKALEYFYNKQDRKTELDEEYFQMKYLLEYVEYLESELVERSIC